MGWPGGLLRPPLRGAREGWAPLGVMEERKDGRGLHRGAGGGETEESPGWKTEGGEAKESDRGFKPPGSILRKSVHWKGSRRLSPAAGRLRGWLFCPLFNERNLQSWRAH